MTKILATIGPLVSSNNSNLIKFIKKTDIIRLNLSHNKIEWHKNVIKKIKSIDKNKKILIDIPGVKPRTLNQKKIIINKNQIVKFSFNKSSHDIIKLSNPIPFLKIKPKNFSLSDGQYNFKFISLENGILIGKSLDKFALSPKKGLNLPNAIYDDQLQKKLYLKFINKIENLDYDFIGLSFIQDSNILKNLKKRYPNKIFISKLENLIGYQNRNEIIIQSDAIMIDRGDLSAEVGFSNLFNFSENIIEGCINNLKPIIIATENFNSLMENSSPSKSDILNFDYFLNKKVDYMMLSDETATSPNWLNTLTWVKNYLTIKNKQNYFNHFQDQTIFDMIQNIKNSTLIIFTKKGYAFKNIASHNQHKIFLFTQNKSLISSSNLYSNVVSIFVTFTKKNIDNFIYKNIKKNYKDIFKHSNYAYVINVSYPRKASRANTISIIYKNDIKF